jgi:hypothetical protein
MGSGSTAQGGNSGTGGSTETPGNGSSSGCSCAVGGHAESFVFPVALPLIGAFAFINRRRRRSRHSQQK